VGERERQSGGRELQTKFPAPTAIWKIDLDGLHSRVHLRPIMLIERNNERDAKKAAFAADRACLFGGQHLTSLTMWSVSRYSCRGFEPSDWRGS
jgi:hypothetical protein